MPPDTLFFDAAGVDGLVAVPARYRGHCPLCPYRIQLGEMIVELPDGRGWAHADCGETEGFEVFGNA